MFYLLLSKLTFDVFQSRVNFLRPRAGVSGFICENCASRLFTISFGFDFLFYFLETGVLFHMKLTVSLGKVYVLGSTLIHRPMVH